MHLKLNRDQLIGTVVREKGYVFPAEGKYAETLVRTGAASVVPAPVESALAEPRGERAVSPRQK